MDRSLRYHTNKTFAAYSSTSKQEWTIKKQCPEMSKPLNVAGERQEVRVDGKEKDPSGDAQLPVFLAILLNAQVQIKK